jgi:hypothetical protein
MSALEIRGDALTPIYTEDRSVGRVLEENAEAALRAGSASLAGSAWGRARRWIAGLFGS